MQNPLEDPIIAKRISYHTRLKKLIFYMQTHGDEPMSLSRAAEVACMEETAFSRFFKRAVGATFRDFLQRWHVATAIDQMSKSDLSLTDIAFIAGFSSLSSFERTFKKTMGFTPSEYREQLLKKHHLVGYKELFKSRPPVLQKSNQKDDSTVVVEAHEWGGS
jgi:transcriptional regulator GlxA family with amidase domain